MSTSTIRKPLPLLPTSCNLQDNSRDTVSLPPHLLPQGQRLRDGGPATRHFLQDALREVREGGGLRTMATLAPVNVTEVPPTPVNWDAMTNAMERLNELSEREETQTEGPMEAFGAEL